MTEPKSENASEPNETAADKAIREALESVERIEAEGQVRAQPGEEQVEILSGDEAADAGKKSTSDALLEATLKAKTELQDVLSQTQKEAKDMFDRLARVSADFENYKKRVGREKDDAIRFGNEKVFKELLPVLDNLLRALGSAPADSSALSQGVKLVAKQFEDALTKFGVVGYDALGQPFDPQKHEAVGARPDEKYEAQLVCEEYQRGYLLHDRLLRPALVIVSSGPAN